MVTICKSVLMSSELYLRSSKLLLLLGSLTFPPDLFLLFLFNFVLNAIYNFVPVNDHAVTYIFTKIRLTF